jgi:tRNA/tmRNA/rRNA uracil-C5-methylase (TrmA/RlmC/RlmD family)
VADTHFDDWIAQHYETLWPEAFEPGVVDPAVDFLADLVGTGTGSALEFVIGTGRIALPLSSRGVSVSGIELSASMIARLNEQDGAAQIRCENAG